MGTVDLPNTLGWVLLVPTNFSDFVTTCIQACSQILLKVFKNKYSKDTKYKCKYLYRTWENFEVGKNGGEFDSFANYLAIFLEIQ